MGDAYEQRGRTVGGMEPFPGYSDSRATGFMNPAGGNNVDSMQEVIRLHRQSCDQINETVEFGYLKKEAIEVWANAIKLGGRAGFRNAQVTVLAPTGTIGFLMDCDTTGIE